MFRKKKESFGFNLFIDEDRFDFLSVCFNLFAILAQDEEASKKIEPEKRVKMANEFQKILDDVIGISHELGWCKDPDCEDNKKHEK